MVTRGKLIAIEGGEAAGKSTQAARLAGSIGAVLSREPGGSPVAERIRDLLLDPSVEVTSARAELYLMLAARAEHLAYRIEPALGAGRHVVVDRFAGSTIAYQGYGRGLGVDQVRQECDLAAGGTWPDLCVLLDLPLEVARRRRAAQQGESNEAFADRIEAESYEFHSRVCGGFRALAADDPTHWVVIDASVSQDEVAGEILRAVHERLGLGSAE
jgi:dTMP kinase